METNCLIEAQACFEFLRWKERTKRANSWDEMSDGIHRYSLHSWLVHTGSIAGVGFRRGLSDEMSTSPDFPSLTVQNPGVNLKGSSQPGGGFLSLKIFNWKGKQVVLNGRKPDTQKNCAQRATSQAWGQDGGFWRMGHAGGISIQRRPGQGTYGSAHGRGHV